MAQDVREIVFDTETTGLDPNSGHRVVEIGCVEVLNRVPTGKTLHKYINPERDMPVEAYQVHGLSEAFLADKPVFADIADEFIDFVGDAPLVAHNAGFDMKFMNAELKSCGRPQYSMENVVDTVQIARSRFPGAAASLDALCKRFGIDNSRRTKHGALLDAELLAEVYLELMGGRQVGLDLSAEQEVVVEQELGDTGFSIERPARAPRPHKPSEAELSAHRAFIEKLENAIWTRAD